MLLVIGWILFAPVNAETIFADSTDFRILDPNDTCASGSIFVDVYRYTPSASNESTIRAFDSYPCVAENASTLVPIFATLATSLALRSAVASLFVGTYACSLVLFNFSFLRAAHNLIEVFYLPTFDSTTHLALFAFVVVLGGFVSVVSDALETHGGSLSGSSFSRRRNQLKLVGTTALLGFDDYTNLIVTSALFSSSSADDGGGDGFASREKIAYLVDVCASAFATLVPVSSLSAYVSVLPARDDETVGFDFVLRQLPFHFYAIFTLVFALVNVCMNAEVGPLKQREEKRLADASPAADARRPERRFRLTTLLFLPVSTLVVFNTAFLIALGAYNAGKPVPNGTVRLLNNPPRLEPSATTSTHVLEATEAVDAFLYGSLASLTTTSAAYAVAKVSTWSSMQKSFLKGASDVLPALVVLVAAWSFARGLQTIGFPTWISSTLSSSGLSPNALMVSMFGLSAIVAFTQGSSWATMAVFIPIAFSLYPSRNAETRGVVGAVVSASMLGAHLSPLSDTTFVAAQASKINVVTHIATQAPYVVLVGAQSCVAFALLPTVDVAVLLPVATACCVVTDVLFFLVLGSKQRPHRRRETAATSVTVPGEP